MIDYTEFAKAYASARRAVTPRLEAAVQARMLLLSFIREAIRASGPLHKEGYRLEVDDAYLGDGFRLACDGRSATVTRSDGNLHLNLPTGLYILAVPSDPNKFQEVIDAELRRILDALLRAP